MTRPDDLENLHRSLLDRRRALVRAHRGTQQELISLEQLDKDPEYEESAQAAATTYTLVQLTDGQRIELAQIDAALARLESHRYGVCSDCEQEIPLDRLQAMPYSLRCADCAAAREATQYGPHHAPPSM